MAYKDKDKQKQAQKDWVRQKRAKQGSTGTGSTKGMTFKARTVTPAILPPCYGQPDCECMHCQQNKANGNKHLINHGPYKTADQLGTNELNRVSLPGDIDYVGVATGLLTQQAKG